MLKLIAQRLGLSYDNFIYCSVDEVTSYLRGKDIIPNKATLNKRDKDGYSIILGNGQMRIDNNTLSIKNKREEKIITC